MRPGFAWGVESTAMDGKHHAVVLEAAPGQPGADLAPAIALERAYIASINQAYEAKVLEAAQRAGFSFVSFTSRAFGKLEEDGPRDYRLCSITLRPSVIVRYDYEVAWAEEFLKDALEEIASERAYFTDIELEPEITFQQTLAHA